MLRSRVLLHSKHKASQSLVKELYVNTPKQLKLSLENLIIRAMFCTQRDTELSKPQGLAGQLMLMKNILLGIKKLEVPA